MIKVALTSNAFTKVSGHVLRSTVILNKLVALLQDVHVSTETVDYLTIF